MFHQSHADAADHAADALAAGRLRVDDAAGAVGADKAPHARLPEIRVNRDFHKHRSEGVHRETTALITGLDVGWGFEGLAEAAEGICKVVTAAARERIRACLTTRSLHGAADARHRHRPAMHRCLRQLRVTEDEGYPLNR